MGILSWAFNWFVQNPHRILWVVVFVVGAALLLGMVPLGITAYIISATIVLAATNAFDKVIFSTAGNSVKTLFSGNRFASRLDGFPMFLMEILLIAYGGSLLNEWLEDTLTSNALPPLFLVGWMLSLIAYYWFVGSREN